MGTAMDLAGLFPLLNALALPGWAILILAPRGRWPWLDAVPALVLPLLFSAAYAALVLRFFAGAEGSMASLEGVRALFSQDAMLLAGWLHYLAFDLLVGAWLARRMDRAGVSRLLQAPFLVLTFLLGPLGALLALATEGALAARRIGAPT
jgi:hypothetical protein